LGAKRVIQGERDAASANFIHDIFRQGVASHESEELGLTERPG
jgi:hypothetical protein